MTTVYKILDEPDWARAREEGWLRGSAHDLRDGFIHFSTGEQLAATARLHFAGRRDLVLLYVDVDAAAPKAAWRWEPARDGALFPHLYAALPMSAVRRVEPLPLGDDGLHRLPELER